MVDTFRLDLTQDPKVISGSRLFDAPRSLVFEAWTDPKHLAHWWGPNGFSLTTHSFDFRAGGVWRFVMHGPDGRDYQNPRHLRRDRARPSASPTTMAAATTWSLCSSARSSPSRTCAAKPG